jgi:CheY-like chemotaxis protein/anti-sigma regulatory factor (Ser/Thr protein kinase)
VEKEMDVYEIVHNFVAGFQNAALLKNISLSSHIHGDVPRRLLGDDARLRQILFNLIGNAVKFTDSGHVQVEVSSLSTSDEESCRLYICVSDTGIGIPDDKISDIFGAFTQADGSFTRKYGGTGLGLHIVKRLVEIMGGKIAVESEPGVGTAIHFSIRLKRPSMESCKDPSIAGPWEGDRQSLHILVVEDDTINRYAVSKVLEKLGHVVKTAENGKEALKMLQKEHFGCVFMDIQMPIMNGIEAVGHIRRQGGEEAKVPVVAVTAHAMSGDKESFLEAGMDDYISKPIDMNEICCVLERVAKLQR